MKKEKFSNILQNGEEIIWCEGINKVAFFISTFFKRFIAVFATLLIAGVFIGGPIVGISSGINGSMLIKTLKTVGIIWIIVFIVLLFIMLIKTILESCNIGFAITNKRVIRRGGAFNSDFIHYSLKNIGTIKVDGGIFDSRGENGSATLIITVKDFHTNTDGNTYPMVLTIPSLKKAYKAYGLLSEKTEGNNESFRVEIEK